MREESAEPQKGTSQGVPFAISAIAEEAARLGLTQVACAPVAEVPEHALFTAWLAADLAGDMTYLGRDAETRRDPRRLLERARSIVCVALSYAHPDPADAHDASDAQNLRGQIARYARGEDYHLVLKRRLQELAARITARFGDSARAPESAYRVCVDSAPLLERALASRAGLGFIGKNTLLITPGIGSYTVLGELLIDLDLDASAAQAKPMATRCGSCRLCIDVCPTGALISEYRIDARRCISYLTIENSGAIPRELRRAIGTWIFGCDLCQEICPWNAGTMLRGGQGADPDLRPRPQHARPELLWLLQLGAAQFRRFVKRTALRRIGRSQLLRNVAVALGNVGTRAELPALQSALEREPPLVRQHLAWAIGEIGLREESAHEPAMAMLRAALRQEADEAVRGEIAQTLTDLDTKFDQGNSSVRSP